MTIRSISIDQILLNPLASLFGTLPEAKRKDYHDSFSDVTDTDLRETFLHLRDNFSHKRYPMIADINGALRCVRQKNKQQPAGGAAAGGKHPWLQRIEEQNASLKSYLKDFEETTVYHQARASGYEGDLLRYVRAAASVQIQMILPRMDGMVRLNAYDLGWETQESDALRKEKNAFWTEQRAQAKTGRISVTVPAEKIAEWHQNALSDRRQPIPNRTEIAQEERNDIATGMGSGGSDSDYSAAF